GVADRRRGQRSGDSGGRARTDLPAVLHHETKRHRAGARAGAEDRGLSQRPHRGRQFAAWRREPANYSSVSRLAATPQLLPTVTIQRTTKPKLVELACIRTP